MSRESGQDRSQKTVAELLALHGGSVEGSRRRRRRAAEEDDEQGTLGVTPSSGRRAGTDPQTLIERARGEGTNASATRREGGRRALPDPDAPPPAPRRQPTDSGPQPRVRPPEHAAPPRAGNTELFNRPGQDSGGFPQPNSAPNNRPGDDFSRDFPRDAQDAGPYPPRTKPTPPQESGAFAWPSAAQESGAYPRPAGGPGQDSTGYARPNPAPPQESGTYRRPGADSGGFPRSKPGRPQDSGGFARPNAAPPQESGAYPRPAAAPPRESGAFPRPSGGAEETSSFAPPGGPLPSRERGAGRRVRPQDGTMRRSPQESAALPRPEPPTPDEPSQRGQDTRARLPRHATPPPPQPGAKTPPPGPLSARLDGLDAGPAEAGEQGGMASGTYRAPDQGGMASGTFQAPPRRRRRPGPPTPPAEPSTEQFRPVESSGESLFEPVADAPPAGLSNWGRGRPDPIATEDTQVGVTPAVPPRPSDPGDELESTGFYDPFAEDEEEDEPAEDLGEFAEGEGQELEDYEYDGDAESEEAAEDTKDSKDAKDTESAGKAQSPARQWLAMAIQLALGVVGGAAVWLAFNWLWGKLPAGALAGAIVVIAGLVWIVRKIRRAEDLQTTVLAVLVGLVVTVSPAALLLLSR